MKCNFLSKECGLVFVAGAVAGVLGMKLAKTDKARKVAVKGIAKGMMVKDCTMEHVANLREEAEDVCNEAREIAKKESEVECECGCETECECEVEVECDCETECECETECKGE